MSGFEIPRYALLDVWMALGGDSQVFERWMENRSLVDAWHQLLAAVRGDLSGLLEDTNPPAGELLAVVDARSPSRQWTDPIWEVEDQVGESEVHDPNPTKHKGEILAYRQGVIDGKTEGFDVGYQQGYDQGYSAGDTDAAVVSIKHGVLGATTEELIRELWRRGTLHEVVDSLVPMKRRFVTDWTVS